EGSSLAHDFADDPAGIEAGKARDVDRRLGVAGADQHPAGPSDQRENVAWGNDRLRSVVGIDRDGDGARAISGTNPGCDSLPRLDRDREGGLVAAAVGAGRRLQPELVGAV